MNPEQYRAFSERLVQNLAADARVLGLVAAGSMAERDHLPDRWSDHDFWIITQDGAQEAFRTEYGWLPEAGQIVLAFRETAHGLKVLFESGHLVEYAVFAPDELAVTRINSYRVLLDRERIAGRLAAIHAATQDWARQGRADDGYLFGQFITNLQVGAGRWARGESLSAHAFVKSHALNHLLPLLAKVAQAERPGALDNIDPLRRFEQAFPTLGEALNAALLCDVPEAARRLLALADDVLRARLPDYPAQAVAAIRQYLTACAGDRREA